MNMKKIPICLMILLACSSSALVGAAPSMVLPGDQIRDTNGGVSADINNNGDWIVKDPVSGYYYKYRDLVFVSLYKEVL